MTFIRAWILSLRLNPKAPWPSQVAARMGYRMRALRRVASC